MGDIAEKSFGINIRIMKVLGFYPRENYNRFYSVIVYFVLFFLQAPPSVLGFLHFVLEKDIFAPYAGITATILTEHLFGLFKFFIFVKNAKEMQKCMHYFDSSDYINSLDNNQKKILNKGVGYLVVCCAIVDPLVGGLACLAASWLSVLKYDLQHLNEYAEETVTRINLRNSSELNIMKSKIIYRKIKKSIINHNSALRFVKLYEDCFSLVIFFQMVGSVLIICFCCFQFILTETWSFDFFSTIGYSICVFSQLYLYCFYGTILYEESNTLTDAIYMGIWYEYDVKCRKCLITLMEISKRPLVITAGKIIDSSLSTFTMIIRRSYSLLAVLKSQ